MTERLFSKKSQQIKRKDKSGLSLEFPNQMAQHYHLSVKTTESISILYLPYTIELSNRFSHPTP